MKHHAQLVGSVDVINKTISPRFRAANLSRQQGIERPFHIPRSERPTIVKRNATMQMKNIGQRIRNLPPLRKSSLNVQVLIASQQSIENKFVDPLRLRVNPNPR